MLNRRHFAGAALAFAGLATQSRAAASGLMATTPGYGPLQPDPAGLLDLPPGFSYRTVSQLGQKMSDGLLVPDRADGMGCFALDKGRIALVRNHELQPRHRAKGPFGESAINPAEAFDSRDGAALPGGTTTLVLDPASLTVEQEYLSLVGTIRNCAGGVTPWNSWLTCEESVDGPEDGVGQPHGWMFDVPADAGKLVKAEPLKAMGRFNREAAAVDPRTGIVYMTEDRSDSLFYRFLPDVPGSLQRGGRLQALALHNRSFRDSRNWEGQAMQPGSWHFADWIDLDNPESPADDLRTRGAAKGALVFARGEGVHWGEDELYFTCTSGGLAKQGQIMRYRPSRHEGTAAESKLPGRLQLFLESTDRAQFSFGDNLTVAPNGHLIVCEDQYDDVVDNHLRGVTPHGEVYAFGRIRVQTEPAGVCFSPDGSTMFVNLYSPTRTLAIRGPF
ncbi:alkaline phosphatase PhoX [Sphingopyxis sp. MWB1]|uniref:alkaline phosphatase PhoX n=1 Tax=Sphingopyxis sp. MWB1 TaxID=1537715 RepID=UPI00051A04F7|nr:alkaline phosphatase PhoX [Sphingopyxis sp. MWB1]